MPKDDNALNWLGAFAILAVFLFVSWPVALVIFGALVLTKVLLHVSRPKPPPAPPQPPPL